ncbi:tRNA (guanine-N(7)-)-methyltransferase non-catalytic subunit wdr4 [Xenentodon cancila]
MVSVVGFSGEWILSTRGSRLVAVHIKQSREPYVFDCSSADRKPKATKAENDSDGGSSEEAGSDNILALVVSPSGKLVALTDDNKRLLVFKREPSWHCISIRWVVRRCVSLVFSQTEEELLVADKSGDVYSFSLDEAEREGLLKMGHLSMLLAVVVSPDNKYIITADRDEKIRVSHHRSPYNIQSFCLGHRQFVSTLHIPSGHPCWLLSGSGDGTLKLWEYKSGNLLQSCDLQQLDQTPTSETDPNLDKDEVQDHDLGSLKQNVVCRISSSPDGHHIAVLCERVLAVQFFTLDQDGELKLVPHSQLRLPQPPLDMAFNPDGQLWVLMESSDVPAQVFTFRQSCWQCAVDHPELRRVTEGLRAHWNPLDAAPMRTNSRFQNLFKLSYDNMTPYLQRKQQRLEEQQMKRTKSQEEDSSKRPRTEPSS